MAVSANCPPEAVLMECVIEAEGKLTGMLTFSKTKVCKTPLERIEFSAVIKIKVGKY